MRWRPEGDGTHRVFFFDCNGAELSRIIDSQGVCAYIIPTTTTVRGRALVVVGDNCWRRYEGICAR